eukprot:16429762-Heterocapsa_arctica.AAC.1
MEAYCGHDSFDSSPKLYEFLDKDTWVVKGYGKFGLDLSNQYHSTGRRMWSQRKTLICITKQMDRRMQASEEK